MGFSVSRRVVSSRAVPTIAAMTAASFLICAAGIFATGARAAGGGPIARVEGGQIAGTSDQGVIAFKGLPYAAAPIGDLRWRPPQPVSAWQGVRPANRFSPLCKQRINTSDNGTGPPPDSEDCLYLNVYAPASKKGGPFAVMFWIHGGGYVNGSGTAPLYEGTALAKQGVVVVTINYRLGRFGFFAHPALTRESPDGPLGNYAHMDQIAALQWVKHNIAAFGGDPGNVTVFGESAGGGSVINLMISPPARGLFHKAISQSGIARIDFTYLSHRNDEGCPSAEELGRAFAEKMGVTATDDVAALRAIPAQRIIDAGDPENSTEGPMIDGKILLSRADVAFAKHAEAPVPLIIGSNALEFEWSADTPSRFRDMLRFPAPEGAKLMSAYGNEEAYRTNIVSDILFTEPAWYVAGVHSETAPSFLYRFSVLSAGAPPELKAAPHASDRQYVFKTLNTSPWPTGPIDEKAADLISAYWVAFAKTGDPNGAGRPKWSRYDRASDQLINFRNDGPVMEKTPEVGRLKAIGTNASNSGTSP
jgi:para-nitrobenzyl esterase